MKELLLKNWQYIVILLCGIIMLVLWQFNLSSRKDYDELKKTIAITEDINKLEAKLSDMKKREAELYPVLKQKESELDSTLSELNATKRKLDKIKKENIKHEIDKMDNAAVSNLLSELGYSNTIISK